MVRQASVKFNDAVSPVSFCFPEQLHKSNVDVILGQTAGDMSYYTRRILMDHNGSAVFPGKIPRLPG